MFYDLEEVLTSRRETSAIVLNLIHISPSNYRSILQCLNKSIFVNGNYIFNNFHSISIFHIKRLHIEMFVNLSPSDMFLQFILTSYSCYLQYYNTEKQSNKTFACKCRYSKMDRCCRLGNGLVKLCVHIQVDNLCRPSGYRNSMYTI